MPTFTNPVDQVPLKLDEIQGNILAGFNKDHQRFLFLQIDDAAKTKGWLRSLISNGDVATTTQVKKFNDLFRAARKAQGGESGSNMPTATWLNIAFNYYGLEKLGADLDGFPDDFKQGMAARSAIIGDVGRSDPDAWDPWLRNRDFLHIIVLIAADVPADLDAELAKFMSRLPGSGLKLVHMEAGEAPKDGSGNEHFGFKDGISQPGVKGFTLSTNPPQPNTGHQGVPGQDLLWPGEFVLGYPTQVAARPDKSFDGPNPAKGPDSKNGPAWTEDGSYLVFRKLQQDVAGFRNSVRSNALLSGVTPEVLGAKIVGRFRSGCPMEHTKDQDASIDSNDGDPSASDKSFLAPEKVNNFEYGDDLDGTFVPRSGHIRKAYPRDEQLLDDNGKEDTVQNKLHESDTQTHRILRRGIPFGEILPFPDGKGLDAQFQDDQVCRGLLFLAYQKSIEKQFEFIQGAWINQQNFPDAGDGVDPVMSQVPQAPLQCPFKGKKTPATLELKHFVTTNGGEYFFQPSLSALKILGADVRP
jgi:Dyp-type peroxidase family